MLIQLLLNGIIAESIYSVITQIAQMFPRMEESVIARNESDGVGGMTKQSDSISGNRLLHFIRNDDSGFSRLPLFERDRNDLYSYVLLERIHD